MKNFFLLLLINLPNLVFASPERLFGSWSQKSNGDDMSYDVYYNFSEGHFEKTKICKFADGKSIKLTGQAKAKYTFHEGGNYADVVTLKTLEEIYLVENQDGHKCTMYVPRDRWVFLYWETDEASMSMPQYKYEPIIWIDRNK